MHLTLETYERQSAIVREAIRHCGATAVIGVHHGSGRVSIRTTAAAFDVLKADQDVTEDIVGDFKHLEFTSGEAFFYTTTPLPIEPQVTRITRRAAGSKLPFLGGDSADVLTDQTDQSEVATVLSGEIPAGDSDAAVMEQSV